MIPKKFPVWIVVCGVLIGFTGACESSTSYDWMSDGGGDGQADTLEDAADAAPDADGGSVDPPPDITGVWARKMYNYSIVNYPMIGPMDTVSISLVRSQITQDGTALVFVEETCAMRMVSDTDLVSVLFPEAFIASIPVETKSGAWESTAQGYLLRQYPFWQVQGAHLEDLAGETLPTDPEDPRVYDQDLDGQPGVTLRATGLLAGEMYIVHRIVNELSGMYSGMERLDGLVTWQDEQNVLAASTTILETPIERAVHPDPTLSRYRFRPVEESTTCADIVENEAAIFPLMTDLFW